MKKIISLLLVLTLMLGLAACGGSNNETTPGGNPPAETQDKGGTAEQTQPKTEDKQPTVSGEITEELLRSWPEAPVSDFTYERSVDYEGIRVMKYLGNDEIVVVPAEIEGQPVVEVAGYCFANDSTVRSVVIPETVIASKEIFINNSCVEIVIAEGLQDVGYATFLNCGNLREVILGDNVTHVGISAFAVCGKLEKLVLPATLTGMKDPERFSAFSECPNLTIYGEAGSYIETVANEQGIPFVAE